MKTLNSAVGRQGLNARADQQTIQTLLNRVPVADGGPAPLLTAEIRDRAISAPLQAAIERFQQRNVDQRFRDGRIDPGGQTLRMLNVLAGEGPIKPHLGQGRPTGVVDFDQPTQRSIDVRAGLVPLKQPSPNACWATVATMMWKLRHRGQISDTLPVRQQISDLLSRTRERHWMDVFEADTGLPQPQINPFFCHTLGMRPMESALHMRVAMGSAGGAYFWVPLLRLTHRPWLLNTGRLDDGAPSAHMVVLIGASLDGDLPNAFAPPRKGPSLGVVSILDPKLGHERRLSGHDIDFLLGQLAPAPGADPLPPELASRMRCLSWP